MVRALVETLCGATRTEDVIARIADDRFALLPPEAGVAQLGSGLDVLDLFDHAASARRRAGGGGDQAVVAAATEASGTDVMADERIVIAEHPLMGERILRSIGGFAAIAEIVRHEHESLTQTRLRSCRAAPAASSHPDDRRADRLLLPRASHALRSGGSRDEHGSVTRG
jgi:hypothetical protein